LRIALRLALLGLASIVMAVCLSPQSSQARVNNQPPPVASNKFFSNCTPTESAEHDCAILERIFSQRFRELDEAPLTSSSGQRPQTVFRISYVTPVAPQIGLRLARIEVHTDSSVEITAKTEDAREDKILSSRSIHLSGAEAAQLLALLQWNEFLKFDSVSHVPPDRTKIRVDGNFCALEGVYEGEFHALYRSQIEQDSESDPAKAKLFAFLTFLKGIGVWQTP